MSVFKEPMVTAAEIYFAAREICSRLYIAMGGDRRISWEIHPHPSTAAIKFEPAYNRFDLYMPAMPVDARLSRREADICIGYVIHELGHALYTDWGVWDIAVKENISRLLNGIEDVRIELALAKAGKSIANAHGMLEMLTEYLTAKATANGWQVSDDRQLSFNIYQYCAKPVLRYDVPSMPQWAGLSPEQAQALDLVRSRIRSCRNTNDALTLAREVAALMPKPPAPPEGDGEGKGAGGAGQGEAGDAGDADAQAQAAQADAGEAGTSEGIGNGAWNDANQNSPEPDLNDMGDRVTKRAGKDPAEVAAQNADLSFFVNCGDCDMMGRYDLRNSPAALGKLLDQCPAPAKLRRDVRLIVRSPARVKTTRHCETGRFDVRDVSRMRAGALNVFRQRSVTPSEAAAVSLLIDLSSSMDSGRIGTATGLGLQLGDALAKAGAPFEVHGFLAVGGTRPRSALLTPKAFGDAWPSARLLLADFVRKPTGGTSQMPAVLECAKRLAAQKHVTRRILLVLADGGDAWGVASNRAMFAHVEARYGVEVVMIGCQCDVSAYGGRFVNVQSLRDIASAGLGALVKALGGAR